MALSYVGNHTGSGSEYDIPDQFFGAFNAVSTFSTGDTLILAIQYAAANNTQFWSPVTYTDGFSIVEAGWTFRGAYQQNTFDGYWFYFTYICTSADNGQASVSFTMNIDGVDSVTGIDPVFFYTGGIAVRSDAGEVLEDVYIPADSTDTDNTVSLSGASPQVGTYVSATGYIVNNDQVALFYITSNVSANSWTAASVAWTGPTEMNDQFQQDVPVGGTKTYDQQFSTAYEFLSGASNWPADVTTRSYTGTTDGSDAHRAGFGFTAPAGAVSAIQEWVPHRVEVEELPYSIHTGMVK